MRSAFAAVFLLAATALHAIDVPLVCKTGFPVTETSSTSTTESVSGSDTTRLLREFTRIASRGTPLQATVTRPEGNYKLPDAQTSQPLYAFLQMGDSKRLIVADIVGKAGIYNRLYFDANGNNDLTDDPPIHGEANSVALGLIKFASFDPVETTVTIGGKPTCVRLIFAAVSQPGSGSTPAELSVAPDYYYSGSFELDGRPCQVAIVDRNCDGRVTASGPNKRFADSLYMNRGGRITEEDAAPVTGFVVVGKQTYAMTFDPGKPALLLKPLESGQATLELADQPQRVILSGDDAASCIAMYDPAREIKVPAGRYRLESYAWDRKDASGDLWRIEADGGMTSTVALAAGQQADMKLGEPYSPTVAARASVRRPSGFFGAMLGGKIDTTQLDFRLVGTGGEVVKSTLHVSGGKTTTPLSLTRPTYPKEPEYKIMKPDGELVVEGAFAYG